MDVENAALTDVGCRRLRNEDAFFASNELKLYVVSDGMGGHKAGDVASRLVVEGMREYIDQVKDLADGPVPSTGSGLSPEASSLVDAIGHANRKVWQAARNVDRYEGMGATVSALWICGSSYVAANVGDSPVYCIHGETIEMVSVSHNLSMDTSVQAEKTPEPKRLKHILTRAVGIRERVAADVCESQCYPGDRFVICSDGLSNRVSEEEILQAANNFSPGDAARTLVELANARGGDDNITVVVVKVFGRERGPFSGWVNRALGKFKLLPRVKRS
ncbi:protein phosphatase 2C domain-containing protein [Desulfoluna sp.]|uniref:PP2C family protein-serine/threonine phosphatase n=1 Tax=Desulfoluna sp. TaxID=2045199 RepID=UPI00262CCB1F|nr:protein phosphatase 2C domain-containing protein [Desulfoluna sp.]